MVAFKSLLNNKLVGVDKADSSASSYYTANEGVLRANKYGVGVRETFLVYFGPDNRVTLRSRDTGNFVSVQYSQYDYAPILTANSFHCNNFVFEVVDLDEVKELRYQIPRV